MPAPAGSPTAGPGWISPDAGQVTLLTGTYRIPEVARPLLRAALLDHQDRGLPAYTLFTCGATVERQCGRATRMTVGSGRPRSRRGVPSVRAERGKPFRPSKGVGDAGSEIDVQFLLDAAAAAGGSAERTTLCSAVGRNSVS